MAVKYKIKKGDLVQVMAGKDFNKKSPKTGKVLKVDQEKGRVVVEGVNIVKKTMKGNPQTGEKGSIVEVEAALSVSNVMVVCPKCGPVRVGIKVEENDKYRVCKKCGVKL
jgi:large subunit ribosomal protein L24